MFSDDILLLAPHPDDEVVGCSAAIDAARARNCRVHVAFLTTGVPPRREMWPWQQGTAYGRRVRRRHAESCAAAAALDIEVCHRGAIPSRELRHDIAQTARVVYTLLEKLRAATLWVPAFEGGHQDHDVANFIGSLFVGKAQVWEFSEYNYCGGRVRSQAFPIEIGRETVIRLTGEEVERKRSLLALYASERGNLRHIDTTREVFRPLPHYDYSRPPHPGPLFYQRFQWLPWHPRIDATRPEEVCEAMRTATWERRGGQARRLPPPSMPPRVIAVLLQGCRRR